jgi:hypothetical protein
MLNYALTKGAEREESPHRKLTTSLLISKETVRKREMAEGKNKLSIINSLQ